MQVKQLFTDDDAVSPVIGVILMVAITVILAAVIASFVLGLGNQAKSNQPRASFGTSWNQKQAASSCSATSTSGVDCGVLTISHDSGDAIKKTELKIRGSGFIDASQVSGGIEGQVDMDSDGGASSTAKAPGTWAGTVSGSESTVVSGDRVKVAVGSDYSVDVVWQSSDTDNSATLNTDKGPDA